MQEQISSYEMAFSTLQREVDHVLSHFGVADLSALTQLHLVQEQSIESFSLDGGAQEAQEQVHVGSTEDGEHSEHGEHEERRKDAAGDAVQPEEEEDAESPEPRPEPQPQPQPEAHRMQQQRHLEQDHPQEAVARDFSSPTSDFLQTDTKEALASVLSELAGSKHQGIEFVMPELQDHRKGHSKGTELGVFEDVSLLLSSPKQRRQTGNRGALHPITNTPPRSAFKRMSVPQAGEAPVSSPSRSSPRYRDRER